MLADALRLELDASNCWGALLKILLPLASRTDEHHSMCRAAASLAAVSLLPAC